MRVPRRTALLMGAAVLAMAGYLAHLTPVGALPPYCTDGCSPYRPCTKECRLPDETIITCGEFGVCEGGAGPSPSPPPPPPPSPSPGTCNDKPTFTASSVTPLPNVAVTFTANTFNIHGPVNWDFGDATHCVGCGNSVTHSYTAGDFDVRLTASMNCGAANVSDPVRVTVSTGGPGPGECGGDGQPVCPGVSR